MTKTRQNDFLKQIFLFQKVCFARKNVFTEVVGLFPPSLTIVCPLALFFLAKIFFVKILRDRRFGGVRHLPDQNLKEIPKIKILKFMREKKRRGGKL